MLLPAEQTRFGRLGAGDQHDDDRIGAGEMLRGARGVEALAQVAALSRLGRAAANAAEAVAAVPVRHGAGVGEHGGLVRRQQGDDPPEVREDAAVDQGPQARFVVSGRDRR